MLSPLATVLLVEDDPTDVEFTLIALRDNNFANPIAVARDGAEALDYLHRRGASAGRCDPQPSLILLDIKLPKVDGLQVLEAIKADEELRVIPVVMLTSSREEVDLVSSYQRGVNAYVVKPVGFAQFLEAVKHLGTFWFALNEPPPGSGPADEVRAKATQPGAGQGLAPAAPR